MTNRQLFTYCGAVFLAGWTCQVLTIVFTDDFDSLGAKSGLMATMVSPLLVTIGFMVFDRSLLQKIRCKPNKRFCCTALLAILVPTFTAFAVLFIATGLHWGQSGWFGFSANGVAVSGGPFLLGLGQQTWVWFAANVLVTAAAYSLLTGLVAVGEEVAWRGLLQGVLTERFGPLCGIVILGFLWAMWHLPIQLAGYNYPENPVLGSLVISPLMLISVSLFYGWLTLKSNSFIPAAIAHGAYNTIEEGIISNIDLAVPLLYLITIKLAVTAATGLLFGCLIRQRLDSPTCC
ncbi:CPBP family intramembrane glutamic endopeptidase [Flavobacterium caeni]|uniref:CAAX protease self-immunity n=1 Tax=Flavobacterium caeni TaxID=490189 RepID=A0A1G5FD31_9FLAO|nr:CPBP family intramembrane glutamic endopeptidase [Flavobacterium caeni]SCY36790.1 CAAX protease self-immunity [Flavobacterium caeni]